MKGSIWPILLLLATAGTAHAANLGTSQTLRAGALEIKISAPASVTRQGLYPLKVTYTNKSDKAVEFSDPFHCGMIWDVEDVASGKVLETKRNYACTADIPPNKVLAPHQTYAGEFKAIISGYPKGEFRITSKQLHRLIPLNYRSGKVKAGFGPKATPTLQEIRFQIR